MEYIIKALRDTYYNERKAYPGLNDLINMLEKPMTREEVSDLMYDINELIGDINGQRDRRNTTI